MLFFLLVHFQWYVVKYSSFYTIYKLINEMQLRQQVLQFFQFYLQLLAKPTFDKLIQKYLKTQHKKKNKTIKNVSKKKR